MIDILGFIAEVLGVIGISLIISVVLYVFVILWLDWPKDTYRGGK